MRTATHTNHPDEIELSFRDEAGNRCNLYYSLKQYAKRQASFGLELYPEPTK